MESNLPNILFILADDLGWGNVAWPGHNPQNDEINTPNIDSLVRNGLQLHRHYVYHGCSPSRASLQTGRLPIHCTTTNDDGLDVASHGIPSQMTTIATKLKGAGYATSMVGKWDCGFATYDKLPINKGYDSFYGYLSKSLDYFSKAGDNECSGEDYIDLWQDDAPSHTSVEEVDRETYLEFLFMDRVNELLDTHSQSALPFFLLYSMHLPHYPSQIPQAYLSTFADDENQCQTNNDEIYPGFPNGDVFQCRSTLQSQVNLMDHIIGKIIARLKENGLYSNTLIIFTSDNGGSLEVYDTAGNNYPLRGGKASFFEGGIRATSFVSGGYLPQARRGQIESGLMHIADWYATLCELAGVDYTDNVAEAAGLPDVDGINMWPLLSGEVSESPRVELAISEYALIDGNYKYIKNEQQKYAIWQGQIFPNASTASQDILEYTYLDCETEGCLFDVVNDPSEYNELSAEMPELAARMEVRLQQLSQTVFQNTQSGVDSCPASLDTDTYSCGCWMALNNCHSFAGPYQNLDEDQINFAGDAELLLNEFESGTGERMEQDNYSIYLALFVMLFVAMVAFIKYCKVIANKISGNELNAIGAESYGAV